MGDGVRLGVKKTGETLKPQEARPEPTPSRVRYQTQRSSARGTYITTPGPQTSAFSRSSSFSPNERSAKVGPTRPRRMSGKLEWLVKSGPETPSSRKTWLLRVLLGRKCLRLTVKVLNKEVVEVHPHLNSYVGVLIPNVMEFGKGTLGR